MVSKIDKLSMERLIMQVGFPYNIKELRSAYRYNVDVNLAIEFERKIMEAKSFNEVRQLVLEYETVFDKSIYVLHMGKLLEKDIDAQRRHEILSSEKDKMPQKQVIITNSKGSLRRCIVNAKELLKGVKVADFGINSATKEIVVYTSKEFVDETFSKKKRDAKVAKRLEQIEEKISLGEIVKYLSPSDLIDICEYSNLGNILAINLYKEKDIAKGQKLKGKNNANNPENQIIDEESLQCGKVFDWDEFESTIRKYSSYIDFDKMLLLANAVFYNMHGNDFSKFTSEEAGELQDFTEKIGELIDTKKTVVTSPRFNTDITFKIISESVDSLNRHFINGTYYEYEELAQLLEDITNGIVPISNISKREYKNTLKLNVEELLILDRNNSEAIQYLIDNDMLESSEIEEFLTLKQKYTNEQSLYFINKGLVKEEKILELYNSGKLTIENLSYVKTNLENKVLNGIVSTEKLVELYLDPEKKDEFEKYRKLYKLLIIDETRAETVEREKKKENEKAIKELERKILNRRKSTAISILEKSEELLDDSCMYDLYRKGLIPIDTVIDYVGYDSVSKLFIAGELKPIDVKRLVQDKILTETMLKEVFKSDDLTETEKLVLIYSSFSSDTDNQWREKCVGYMPGRQKSTTEPTGQTRESNEESQETQSSQSIKTTDPWARWNLISGLDKDYSQEYLKDGYIVFYLPNISKYVIEKLYDKKNEPAYGAATYIIDESVFEQHKDYLINDKGDNNRTINKSYLVGLNKNKTQGIKKIIHTGWANAIIRYFDVENPQKYTPEQMKQLKEKAKMVEKSKDSNERED